MRLRHETFAAVLDTAYVALMTNLLLAAAYSAQGGWKTARIKVDKPCPDEDECTEEALATREPGGALNPAG